MLSLHRPAIHAPEFGCKYTHFFNTDTFFDKIQCKIMNVNKIKIK